MAEKKKDAPSPRFEVKKRQPKEKPNFFQNIPSFKHPLAEILNFPADREIKLDGDTQKILPDAPTPEISGHPEIKTSDTQNLDFLDAQILNNLDTQPNTTQAPKSEFSGHPETKISGVQAPKYKTDAPRTKKGTGALAPRKDSVVHSKNQDWRKYDKVRSTVRVNLHIDKDIDKKVRQYCMIDAQPKVELREFYEQAALHFLNLLGTQNLDSLGAQAPLDDRRLKMLYKTKPFIINLYLRYNSIFNELAESGGKKWSARWSPRDDESAGRYNEVPPAIIELGILQTQIQKGFGSSRIQTFKYYTDEIEKVLASGVSNEMLATILQYHRQLWKNQTGREVDLQFLEDKS
jgi:hypothetical protein